MTEYNGSRKSIRFQEDIQRPPSLANRTENGFNTTLIDRALVSSFLFS